MNEPKPREPAGMLRSDNRRMLAKLLVIALLMFGFGYALVPMYRSICNALGINVLSLSERAGAGASTSREYDKNTQVDSSRSITIEFDANARGLWEFKPATGSLRVHPGELATVMYEFRNTQDHTMAAQAIPSYAPNQAMRYFNKLECFCFNQYTLKPGESKHWPVVFVIDPKLPRDIHTITLSYTFFEVGGQVPAAPDSTAQSAAGARSQGNAGPLPSLLDPLGGRTRLAESWGRSQGNAGPLPSFLDPLGGRTRLAESWGRS